MDVLARHIITTHEFEVSGRRYFNAKELGSCTLIPAGSGLAVLVDETGTPVYIGQHSRVTLDHSLRFAR